MAKNEKPEKPPTKYQQVYNVPTSREVWCGQKHSSIEEAIIHAETNLGMRGHHAEPYWGTMRFTNSVVVGWQVSERKRYRLDYAHNFASENEKAAKWSGTKQLKGTRGVHVNEENFDDPKYKDGCKVCHPTEASLQWADTYWNKWTRQYRYR
jgi:hypothetical protein